jgi:hypothetical protein
VPYNVVFIEKDEEGRAVGENVFLSALPANPKVFALFYPGSTESKDTERRLRALGERAGDNLWVNLGLLRDPDYQQAARQFRISRLPVVVVTATSPLASTPEGDTAFVRLDSDALFAKPDDLQRTVETVFNLFLSGRLKQAIVTGWIRQEGARLAVAAERVWSVLQPVVHWLAKRDVAVEFSGVKIEVKESGG